MDFADYQKKTNLLTVVLLIVVVILDTLLRFVVISHNSTLNATDYAEWANAFCILTILHALMVQNYRQVLVLTHSIVQFLSIKGVEFERK